MTYMLSSSPLHQLYAHGVDRHGVYVIWDEQSNDEDASQDASDAHEEWSIVQIKVIE